MTTRKWKVYGISGHRQRMSFGQSIRCDWSENGKIRIVEIENFDKTSTNDYSLVTITRETADECYDELMVQISDGFFENARVGKIEEVRI